MNKILCVLLVLSLLIVCCSAGCVGTPPNYTSYQLEQEVFSQINSYRVAYGVPGLIRSNEFDSVCDYNSQRVIESNYFEETPVPDIYSLSDDYGMATQALSIYSSGDLKTDAKEIINEMISGDYTDPDYTWANIAGRDLKYISIGVIIEDDLVAITTITFY